VLVTVLTKKMAEELTTYYNDLGLRVKYMHSDLDAIERNQIIRSLRLGEFDVLVGINLLREGLDLPEVSLVAILDADKEGFLRSETALIQTARRAARNVHGKVLMYAKKITPSMQACIEITQPPKLDAKSRSNTTKSTASRPRPPSGSSTPTSRWPNPASSTTATPRWRRCPKPNANASSKSSRPRCWLRRRSSTSKRRRD